MRLSLHVGPVSGHLHKRDHTASVLRKLDDFKKDVSVVTLGVLLAAAVTAVGMHYALGWNWGSAIIFGVLIAATDPVSVIATFKEAGVKAVFAC
jgi:NhaP-type Na+/H+ or K+/H+ antiporter